MWVTSAQKIMHSRFGCNLWQWCHRGLLSQGLSEKDSGLSMRDTNDVVKIRNWRSAPVETCTEYHTILGNRTTSCVLGKCISDCTDLGSVQYKNLWILPSKQLSRITNSYLNSTYSSTFSTGNAPKDLIIDQCYMADHIDAKSKIDSKKKEKK